MKYFVGTFKYQCLSMTVTMAARSRRKAISNMRRTHQLGAWWKLDSLTEITEGEYNSIGW